MITCTLGEKKYTMDFVSGRALREMEPAVVCCPVDRFDHMRRRRADRTDDFPAGLQRA